MYIARFYAGTFIALFSVGGVALAQSKAPLPGKPNSASQGQVAAVGAQMNNIVLDPQKRYAANDEAARRTSERLAALVKSAASTSDTDVAAFQKQVETCNAATVDRQLCFDGVAKSVRSKRPLLGKAGIDVALEAGKLRKELGMASPGVQGADTAKAPEDLSLNWTANELSLTPAPLGNVAHTIPLNDLRLLSSEGHVDFISGLKTHLQRCETWFAGACYARGTIGGSFTMASDMNRGVLRMNLRVLASAYTLALLAYANAEVQLRMFVAPGPSESGAVCTSSIPMVRSTTPVIGSGAPSYLSELTLNCTFTKTPGAAASYFYGLTTETWSGSGGLGSVAWARAVISVQSASVSFSPDAG